MTTGASPTRSTSSLSRALAKYGLPVLVCLAVHAVAARTWFIADDFEWLALRFQIHSPSSLLSALFAPRAQGTMRTLSERVYYTVLSALFGLNPVPFHVVAFAVMAANLVLLTWIASRLTGSRVVGTIASILWIANAAQTHTLGLVYLFNQVLCAFFLLAAFYCFLRYTETGQRRYYVAQWACFVLGFGALETMVVYPILAALYAWLFARRYLASTIPLFFVSAAFVAVHLFLVPRTDERYAMYFDVGMLSTLWDYWRLAVSGWPPERAWSSIYFLVTVLVTMSLVVFIRMRPGQRRLAGFLIAWFVVLLLPVLPLRMHISQYYATAPAIGWCILLALALHAAFRQPFAERALTVAAVAFYLLLSIGNIEVGHLRYLHISERVHGLVQRAQAIHNAHPNARVLLAHFDSDLFWYGVWDIPASVVGYPPLLLAPGEERNIDPLMDFSQYVSSSDLAARAIQEGRLVVLDASDPLFTDITQQYRTLYSPR